MNGQMSQTPKGGTSTGGAIGGTGTFDPGTSAVTINALLDLMAVFSEVASILEKQEYQQAEKQATMAKSLANFNDQVGKQMFTDAMLQGFAQIASGGITLGAAATALKSPAGQEENSANLKGAREYQNVTKEQEPLGENLSDIKKDDPIYNRIGKREVIGGKEMDERLQKLKDKSSFAKKNAKGKFEAQKMTDQEKETISILKDSERADLQSAIDAKVKSFEDQDRTFANTQASNMSTRTNVGQALGQVTSGSLFAGSAEAKKEQQEYQGQIAAENVALQASQGASSQFRQTADSKMNEVSQEAQNMAAISNANALAGG